MNKIMKHNEKIMKYTCCICHKKFTGYGNDPQPVKQTGRCCDHCNQTVVIPARIKELNDTIAEW